jgi:23S rRNA (uracil1939-C5)-methyltransferase
METVGFGPGSAPGAGEVRVERLALDGEGVAADGLRVPFALPGERLVGRGDGGVLLGGEVLEASRDRVAPPCRHFGTCGGCVIQHASDGFVASWKAGVVARALAARGLEAPMRPVVTSPARSRRRAVFAGRRTRAGAVIGFHAARSDAIVAVEECHVVRPELVAARPALAALVMLGASRAKAVRLGVTWSEGGLDVAVSGAKRLDAGLREAVAGVAGAHDLARLAWEGEVVAVRRPAAQAMGRARVVPPPGGFLQATAEGAAALTAAVREAVGGAARVADLFAGVGTFALPLAEQAAVHAVEGDGEALAALAAGWRAAPGLRRVTIQERDLFRRPLLGDELAGFDAVVVDPPRAGAEAQMRAIAASRVPVVAAVSCNPVSFARDVAVLGAGGFKVEWVQVVDQFRWSAHVEIVARLVREKRAGRVG